MSEIFSNKRLIDYFLIIDVIITNINQNINNEIFDKISTFNTPKSLKKSKTLMHNTNNTFLSLETSNQNFNQTAYLKSEYIRKISKIYPKKQYTDIPEINFESILLLMQEEKIYLNQHQNEFFTFVIKPINSNVLFYMFFLCIYTPLNTNSLINGNNIGNNNNSSNISINTFSSLNLFSPKYLCFLSRNPFFFSFRSLLEDIYANSIKNNTKCFKIESILNILLYRLYLPKSPSFQTNFCLGDKVFNFFNDINKSEISYKIIFNYLSIDNILLTYFAMMMNSVIVILHNDIETIGMLIYIFKQLFHPLEFTYSVITNLTNEHLELLECNHGLMVGVNKNDFNDLRLVMNKNSKNVIYLDIDENILISEKNVNIKEKTKIPNEKMRIMNSKLRNIFNEGNNPNILLLNQQNNVTLSNDSVNNNMTIGNYRLSLKYNQTINQHQFLTQKFEQKENILIQNVFYEFLVEVFIPFNQKKHIITLEENEESIFDYENFIKDSSSDLKPLLNFLKESSPFQVFIDNLVIFCINQGKLDDDIIDNFNLFFLCLEKKKKNKEISSLFINNVSNTISISSPPYEKLSYKQNNIFVDPFHDMMFKHSKAVEYNKSKIKLNMHLNDNESDNELCKKFKKMLLSQPDVVKSFFGISTGNLSNSFHSSLISSINVMNSNLITPSFISTKKINTKAEYIKSFNELIKNLTFKGEFHINVAYNIVQTYSLCPHCNKPNNIWDIRKSFEFSKARRETRTKCKFCSSSFVPTFKAIIEVEENKNKQSLHTKIKSLNNSKRLVANNKKVTELVSSYKTIEYMSFEHLITLFLDNQNDALKKVNYHLVYNMSLLIGEIKCMIEGDEIVLQKLSSYIKEQQQSQMKPLEIFRQPTYKSKKSLRVNQGKTNGNYVLSVPNKSKDKKKLIETEEGSLVTNSKISSGTGKVIILKKQNK